MKRDGSKQQPKVVLVRVYVDGTVTETEVSGELVSMGKGKE